MIRFDSFVLGERVSPHLPVLGGQVRVSGQWLLTDWNVRMNICGQQTKDGQRRNIIKVFTLT